MSHLAQALLVGFASFVATMVVAEALWRYWVKYPQSTGAADELSLQLGFFQVVSAFAATFLAGLLGWFAIKEFSEQHQMANMQIDLSEKKETEHSIGVINKFDDDRKTYIIDVHIYNYGPIIASWFMVRINLSCLYGMWVQQFGRSSAEQKDTSQFLSKVFRSYEGNIDEHWRIHRASSSFGKSMRNVEELFAVSIEFFSNGKFGIYPGNKMKLCAIEIQEDFIKVGKNYWYETAIISDKGDPITTRGKFKFYRNDPSDWEKDFRPREDPPTRISVD